MVVIVGLVAHCAWRLVLAVRGEPGSDDDSGSIAKRLGNVGRAAIYISFTVAAVKLLMGRAGSSGGGGGSTEKKARPGCSTCPAARPSS